MTNTIYTSEKVVPYVYMGTHKETGQFYIGSSANKSQKLPSHLDLGTRYFTSSKYIKELGFENFNWIIIAEFFDGRDAYIFEQELIKDNWENKLKLNRRYQEINGEKHWSVIGLKFPNRSEEHNVNISKGKKAKNLKHTEQRKRQISEQTTGENNPMFGKKHSQESIERNRKSNTGKIVSEESRKKMSLSGKGKKRTRIIIVCPHCGKEGDASNMKRWHYDNCKLINDKDRSLSEEHKLKLRGTRSI
jgi:predicted GIY-YIG superfamily endonuclease